MTSVLGTTRSHRYCPGYESALITFRPWCIVHRLNRSQQRTAARGIIHGRRVTGGGGGIRTREALAYRISRAAHSTTLTPLRVQRTKDETRRMNP
jgi:hypothetical protein